MRQTTLLRRTALTLLAAFTLGAGLPAWAQGKITRLVVAFPSGGPVDFVARAIGEQLGKELGHQVIVENKAGANGAIAAEYVPDPVADQRGRGRHQSAAVRQAALRPGA